MLTADLVQARVRRGVVEPRYIDPGDAELLRLADTLAETFKTAVGSARGELEAELKDVAGSGTAFFFHRALAKLLFDRCEFATVADVEPASLRRAVFEAAAENYRQTPAGCIERSDVLSSASASLGVKQEELERNLYADLKEEQLLEKFKSCTAPWLLNRYNVALAQGVLLKANAVTVDIPPQKPTRYRELFRQMKFCQLLYQVEGTASKGYRLRLDGPLSLFRSSQKYGLQLASFLPSLLHCESWRLEAEVVWGKERTERVFRLTPEAGLESHTRSRGQWQPEEMLWLGQQFPKLKSGWTVSAATELVDLGGRGVLVPDCVFEHAASGRKVFFEAFGFWRRGAVESRLELLKEHGPKNLILALGKGLHVDADHIEDLPATVYAFRHAPVAREVLALLRNFED